MQLTQKKSSGYKKIKEEGKMNEKENNSRIKIFYKDRKGQVK